MGSKRLRGSCEHRCRDFGIESLPPIGGSGFLIARKNEGVKGAAFSLCNHCSWWINVCRPDIDSGIMSRAVPWAEECEWYSNKPGDSWGLLARWPKRK
jgi:hypothetical protein